MIFSQAAKTLAKMSFDLNCFIKKGGLQVLQTPYLSVV